MPRRRWPARRRCWTTWPATPTARPLATSGWCAIDGDKVLLRVRADDTRRQAHRRHATAPSSSRGFCSMCCPQASSASATTGCWLPRPRPQRLAHGAPIVGHACAEPPGARGRAGLHAPRGHDRHRLLPALHARTLATDPGRVPADRAALAAMAPRGLPGAAMNPGARSSTQTRPPLSPGRRGRAPRGSAARCVRRRCPPSQTIAGREDPSCAAAAPSRRVHLAAPTVAAIATLKLTLPKSAAIPALQFNKVYLTPCSRRDLDPALPRRQINAVR